MNTTGTKNTALGRSSGSSITTGSNLTTIGYNAQASSATATNEITLGDTNVTTVRMGNGDVVYPSAGGGTNTPNFYVYRNGNQSLSNATTTKIQFNAETYDTASAFDSTTNYRFTPQTSGKYFLTASYFVGGSTANVTEFQTYLYKNGSTVAQNEVDRRTSGNGYNVTGTVNAIVEANGSTDYFEVYARVTGGGTKNIISGNYLTFFQGYKIIE